MEDMEITKTAVSSELLNVLKSLMEIEPLNSFYLAGETALALFLGHRTSIDIDLFTGTSFNSQHLAELLERNLKARDISFEYSSLRAYIRNIKLDLLMHDYPLLEKPNLIDGIRIAGLSDLAAFKLNAVAGRGFRKDFWDLAYLLETFTFEEMIGFFRAKYASADLWHLIKSLTFFDDADTEMVEIQDLHSLTWQEVKTKITKAANPILNSQLG